MPAIALSRGVSEKSIILLGFILLHKFSVVTNLDPLKKRLRSGTPRKKIARMSDGEGSDYDVPDLPPMLPEMDDLPPVRGLSSPSANAASHQTSNGTDGHDDAGNSTQNGDAAAPPAEKPKKIRKPVPKLDAIR